MCLAASSTTPFSALNPSNDLFAALLPSTAPVWWKTLAKDPDINIEVRKNNCIDVYYNGGAIIRELKYNARTGFSGKIHREYIPIDTTHDYVNYSFTPANDIDFSPVKIESASNFSSSLSLIKKQIAKSFPSDSEKAIQSKFIRNDPAFIDSEFQYKHGHESIRIDLVRIDEKLKKIVFVELKRIGDARLYNGEIALQLDKYNNFIKSYGKDLETYYRDIFVIKKSLGILPERIKSLPSLAGYTVEPKLLLLFGDANQQWIDKFSPTLDQAIRPHAYGAYYFGKPEYNCDLIMKTNSNRHIF